jgi:hypothetical protein
MNNRKEMGRSAEEGCYILTGGMPTKRKQGKGR